MNVRASHDLRGRVVLAHQLPFRVGALMIDPAMRRITHEDGREEILEQRVMQVFVALVRAKGDILSRDDLIACCWDGRVVGDDAINRVMSRLRRVSEGIGDGIFRIETITKVGYRLAGARDAAAVRLTQRIVEQPPASRASRWRSRWLRSGLAALLAGVLAAAVLLRLRPEATETVVRVDPFEIAPGDFAARDFGRDLSADISRFGNANLRGFAVIEPGLPGSGAPDADYIVRASIRSGGGRIRALARLVQMGDGEIVWSRAFERPIAEADQLREQMAIRIADVMTCTSTVQRRRTRLDEDSIRLIFSACARWRDNDKQEIIPLFQQIVRREPDFAAGWAWLAVVQAIEGGEGYDGDNVLLAEARRNAARALALDPSEGNAYWARAMAWPGPRRWVAQLPMVESALALDADSSGLWKQYHDILRNIGHLRASVWAADRSAALDPLSPTKSRVQLYAYLRVGETDAALRIAAQGERLWPETMGIPRFRIAMAAGEFRRALSLVEGDPFYRDYLGPDFELIRRDLRLRVEPNAADRAGLLADLRSAVATDPGNARVVLLLARHGTIEEALRALAAGPAERWSPDILFESDAAALRRDPRFLIVAQRHGLVRYWLSSGQWPDFCAEPDLPYDCRIQARRLLASR